LLTFFGVEREKDGPVGDVFPLGTAPFIRLSKEGQEGGRPALVAEDGMYGLLPHFATELKYGRRTYNARSETVAKLPSFRQAWAHGQRCIIPAEALFEPCYETGKAVRWCISQVGDVPLGVAGIYRRWRDPDGGTELLTFCMLTVNCDDHPFYKRFHAPGEEKRMPVILDRDQYLPWLSCSLAEAPRYFQEWHGPLIGQAAPNARPARLAKEPPPQGELF
jgi:putative SOS response-associated peptidase YedK